jgi:uncharacterized protein (TIGR02270 family)
MPVVSTTRRLPDPLWEIVEETLDEAEFLWRRWQDVLWTHAHGLDGVSFWVEERLLGAIDGLHVAGETALDSLLIPALGADDLFRAAVAAHVIATAGEPRGTAALVAAFCASDGDRLVALEHGLELVRDKTLFAALDRALAGAGPEHHASVLRMRAFQQRDPGPEIGKALDSDHPGLQAAALQALRHTAAVAGAVAVERHLDVSDQVVRGAAIEAGLVRGIGAAWRVCRELVASPTPDSGRALLLVALLGLKEDQAKVIAAVADEDLRADALFALGFAGTRAAADACIEAMAAESDVQLAGEAFAAITGLDLEAERLIAPRPGAEPEEPIPFEDEDLDANLVPAPADLLPWPDVGGVIRWWNAHRDGFVEGQRYVRGIPADLTALQAALLNGPMRRRHAIALELAVRTGGRYQVETRALTATQRRQMQAFDLLGGVGIRQSRLSKSFSAA